jgi:uncharacterized protein (DUF2062 family)
MKIRFNRKTLRQLYVKLIRLQGSPDSIARGVAIGLFIGFLIPIGGQMSIALPLALICRAKVVPALACTWLTNPYTIIFIYPVQCYLGSLVIGKPLSLHYLEGTFAKVFKVPNWDSLMALGNDILIPFFVGGALFGIILAVAGYFTTYGLIMRHRQKMDEKLRRRLSAGANSEK